MIALPEALRPVLTALQRSGRPRLVGGCVRDALRGLPPTDLDIEVAGLAFDDLVRTLRPFGATDVVGRSFGTVKLHLNGVSYDFSLPRRESKTGAGHRGFHVDPEPDLDDAAAAARRDFTINAMAWDPLADRLIDPHGGARDLEARILRHTSPAFTEDPLRVLRAMQFAARFDFDLAPETAELCRSVADTYQELPRERVWGEWEKWATLAVRPSRGLQVLRQTDWLRHFPEIAALVGTPQDPAWHPEGDVFIHTGHCLDALVRQPAWADAVPDDRQVLMFATLAHDFGKPTTTTQVQREGRLRWVSPGHAAAGAVPTETFLQRLGAPLRLAPRVLPLVRNHMAHLDSATGNFTDAQVRRLARRLAPATLTELVVVMHADTDGRPPRTDPDGHARIEALAARAAALAVTSAAPAPLLLGRHLIERGLKPGPAFAPLLAAAYEAQLDGVFSDEAGSLNWLDNHLKPGPT